MFFSCQACLGLNIVGPAGLSLKKHFWAGPKLKILFRKRGVPCWLTLVYIFLFFSQIYFCGSLKLSSIFRNLGENYLDKDIVYVLWANMYDCGKLKLAFSVSFKCFYVGLPVLRHYRRFHLHIKIYSKCWHFYDQHSIPIPTFFFLG